MSGFFRTLARRESAFSRILVREERGERHLVFEGTNAVQSVGRVGAPGYPVLPYVRALAAAAAILPPPRRVLVVGLGGGTVPMFFRGVYPNTVVDVVEVDPAVVEVACEWFELVEDSRLRVTVFDARAFLERTRRRWDLAVLDAYSENKIPPHLATREFLELVRRRLAPGGAALANLWGSSSNRLYRPMLRTYQEVFADLWLVRPPHSGNRIVVALPEQRRWSRDEAARAGRALKEAAGLRFDPGALLAKGLSHLEDQVGAAPLADTPVAQ